MRTISKQVDAACDHEWEPFSDPPYAGNRGWYWQCRLCRAVGYARRTAYQRRLPLTIARNIKIYRCGTKGCDSCATRRVKGRNQRGDALWSCDKHFTEDEPTMVSDQL